MKTASLLPLIFFSFLLGGCQTKLPERPNVLLILTDDQGWGDLSIHGNKVLETPVIDNLIRNGAEFEQFYVSPLCAPTRASLLTGRYHLRTGVSSVSNGLEVMDTQETTLAELFKANGYSTGIFGKWHNGSHSPNRPTDQGFDEFIGFCAGHLSNYFNTTLDSGFTEIKTKGYITDVLTDRALDFIDRNKEKPFFCYVPYNAPHSPFQVPDAYFDTYKEKGLEDELATIYGMVENVDDNIKRLLDKLEKEGLTENTIVLFMTDNGPNGVRFNGSMKGIKGHVDEGGVRVPLGISWPGKIQKGKKIKTLAAHIDIYPTLQSLCKLTPVTGRPLDGMDLTDRIFHQEPTESERQLFTHVAFLDKELKDHPGSLRTDRYRFVLKDEAELYNMEEDPTQQKNLAEENPGLVSAMKEIYQNWFTEASRNFRAVKPVHVHTHFVELPAYEASFTGSLKYAEGHGWAHDWLLNWTSSDDQISWTVASDVEITLKAYLKYTAPEESKGSILKLLSEKSETRAEITRAFDPALLPSPDRVKRKEAYEKEWAELSLGTITVPAGVSTLTLKAGKISGGELAHVKSLILKK